MPDEEILYGIPKVNPINFNTYVNQYFTEYLLGLTPEDIIALFSVLFSAFFAVVHDETENRGLNIEYLNETGKPVFLSIIVTGTAGNYCHLYIGGIKTSTQYIGPSGVGHPALPGVFHGIVPVGSTFKIEPDEFQTLNTWIETY